MRRRSDPRRKFGNRLFNPGDVTLERLVDLDALFSPIGSLFPASEHVVASVSAVGRCRPPEPMVGTFSSASARDEEVGSLATSAELTKWYSWRGPWVVSGVDLVARRRAR